MQLGRIAFWAARCEAELSNIIVWLTTRGTESDEQFIRGLIRGANWNENVERLKWLLKEQPPTDAEYIAACLSSATAAMPKRHHLVHGVWVDAADGFVVVQERRGKADQPMAFRDADAASAADALSAAADQLTAAAMVADGVIAPDLIDLFRRDNGGRVFPPPADREEQGA